jgi:hypothetical protein
MTWLTSIRWPKVGKVTSATTGSIVLLIALLTALSIYHWVILGVEAAPPGPDGGNWLALSMELFGDHVKAAEVAYPPLFLVLLRGALWVLSPLTALKVLGLMAAVCVSIPAYLILRTAVSPWLAALLAAAIPAMDYHNEILAWGGYPQLLGAAFLVLSIYLLLQGLHTGKGWFFGAFTLCAVATVATHVLAAIQLALAVGILLAIHVYERRGLPSRLPRCRLTRPLVFWLIASGILLALVIPVYTRTFTSLADNPFNPQQFDLLRALAGFGSWPSEYYLWLAVAVLGIAFTGWVVLSRRQLFLANAAMAIGASSLLAFVAIREIRSFHLLQVGLLLSVGVIVTLMNKQIFSWLARLGRRVVHFLTIVFIVAILSSVLLFGYQRAERAFDYYRVVDGQVLAALDWLRDRGTPGDRVIANETPRGGILGWWVEGYARLPTYLAVDTRWLSFRDERSQAEIAHRFLSADTGPEELRRLAETYQIKFLLLHRETLQNPLTDLFTAGFEIGFANETMIILTYGDVELNS